MTNIKIYTTPWCAFCKMAKEYFQSKGWAFQDFNVMEDLKARDEMVSKSGQLAVPVIDINGKIIVGFDRGKIDAAAAAS